VARSSQAIGCIGTNKWTSRGCSGNLASASPEDTDMRIPLTLSLTKTATFAVVHFAVAFAIAYLLTGSISIAGAIALIEPAANTVAYFFHERAWARYGRSRTPWLTRLAMRSK
jgi:uncharacterized membrane protein